MRAKKIGERTVTIRLRDTDATGFLYFTEQLRLAVETLEELFSVAAMLKQGKFCLPIVHAEADYFAPLTVGDVVKIKAARVQLGTSSFTLRYYFLDPQGEEVGTVTIVHVAIDAKKKSSISVPPSVVQLLRKLPSIDLKS